MNQRIVESLNESLSFILPPSSFILSKVACRIALPRGKLLTLAKHQKRSGFMRHKTLIISSIVSFALFLSGWGLMVAAALCPHAGVESSMTTDHSCCRAKLERAPEDHRSALDQTEVHAHSSLPDAMNEIGMTDAEGNDATHKGIALKQTANSCAHCVNRSELPTSLAAARQLHQMKRGAHDAAATPAITTFASLTATFAPVATARGHGPPGVAARRHLLISVFLI